MTLTVQDFSTGYWLVGGVDVLTHQGTGAICAHDLLEELEIMFGRPVVVSTGMGRMKLRGEWGVPSDVVAFPKNRINREGDPLLIEKQSWMK